MDATILCIASYEKGADFLRECHRLGSPAILVTVEKLAGAEWPRDALRELHWLPSLTEREDVIHAISWLARSRRIARIVPLDEFDLEVAAALREHLRLPGIGETAVRFFRDKLAMRQKAAAAGVRVPRFTGVFNDDDVRTWTARVPAPWVLKPRTEAAAIGIRKLGDEAGLWSSFEELSDRRSHFLLEEFVNGDVYHVDAIVDDRRLMFAAVSRYASPPFEVAHGGGLFSTMTVRRGSAEERALLAANEALVSGLGVVRGVLHTEFIRADDGGFVFLETAARVGGAHIVEMVEAGTGVNLWREWARVELASLREERYSAPQARRDYAAILISLARQQSPDTSAYDDPEVVWRLEKRHHAGLIVASSDPDRVARLIDSYMPRFRDDFYAFLPAPDRPTA